MDKENEINRVKNSKVTISEFIKKFQSIYVLRFIWSCCLLLLMLCEVMFISCAVVYIYGGILKTVGIDIPFISKLAFSVGALAMVIEVWIRTVKRFLDFKVRINK